MNHQEDKTTSIAIIAIVAALALVGRVVAITIVTIPLLPQAEARGCPASTVGVNASKGLCFGQGRPQKRIQKIGTNKQIIPVLFFDCLVVW